MDLTEQYNRLLTIAEIFLNGNLKVHENVKECATYFTENVCY